MVASGCGDTSLDDFESLGSGVAGRRGEIQVVFFNHTGLRAVFTAGTYDQADRQSEPDFVQFGLDENDRLLDPGGTSGALTLTCGRVFAIGSPELLQLIAENLPNADLEPEAVVEGADFYTVPADDVAGEPVLTGNAPAFEANIGEHFPCNALLIIDVEIDDSNPNSFRFSFQLIPSESDR